MILKNDMDLFSVDQTEGFHSLSAIIHTKTADINVYRLISFDVISDFVESYADRVVLKGMITQSQWVKDIMQVRTNLEMTVIKRTSMATYVTRYKAVIPDTVVKEANFDVSSALGHADLDLGGLAMCEIHGKHLFVEVAPLPSFGGTFSNVTLDAIMSKCIKHYMGQTPLPGGSSLDECIVVPAHNQKAYPQVTIPSGTPLLRLPSFLQTKYGVYTANIGSYLRPYADGSKVWWIYPLTGGFKWTDNVPKLSIMLPNDKLDRRGVMLRNTIQREDSTLLIVAHITDVTSPAVDHRPTVRPTGFKIIDTDRTIETPMDYQHGEVKVGKGDRYKQVEVYSRDDSLPMDIPTPSVGSNYYVAASMLSSNTVTPTVVRWENGVNELLTPGMITQVIYDKTTRGEKGIGRLTGCHSICTPVTKSSATAPLFQETCMLTINLETNQ